MAFVNVSAPTKYVKYSECNPEQILVQNAVYQGSEQGTYGIQHVFMEKKDNQRVVLNSAGLLNHLIETRLAHLTAPLCRVVYKGKITLDKGAMKGKEAHQFELLVDEESLNANTVQAEKEIAASTTSLDDLE
jgi:hypothetical protein